MCVPYVHIYIHLYIDFPGTFVFPRPSPSHLPSSFPLPILPSSIFRFVVSPTYVIYLRFPHIQAPITCYLYNWQFICILNAKSTWSPRTLKPKTKCSQTTVGVLPDKLGSSASESWMGLSPCFQFPFSCRAPYPYLLHCLDPSLLTFTFGIPTNANVWLPLFSISPPHCIRCRIRLTFFTDTSFICSVA